MGRVLIPPYLGLKPTRNLKISTMTIASQISLKCWYNSKDILKLPRS